MVLSPHENHITNGVPAQLDDYSTNVTQMQSTADPGEVGSESLATTLAGEIERLRFAIKEIKATTLGLTSAQWYTTATGGLDLSGGSLTFKQKDTNFSLVDDGDVTKILKFEASGITTGTTRTLTIPDANIKVVGHATGLTSTRVPFATGATGGVLTDSASMTFDGSILTTNGGFSTPQNSGSADAITLTGTAAGVGITIGADTNIYRSAANNLKTDDSFTVTGALTVNGNVTLGDAHTVNGALTITDDGGVASLRVIQSGGGDMTRIGGQAAGNGGAMDVVNGAATDYEPLNIIGEYIAAYARTGVLTTAEITRVTSTGLGVFCTPEFEAQVKKSKSGGQVVSALENSSDTASSDAQFYISVAGSSAGDAFITLGIEGGVNVFWSMGPDNSASDSFKISKAVTLGSNDYLTIATTSVVTLGNGAGSIVISPETANPYMSFVAGAASPVIGAQDSMNFAIDSNNDDADTRSFNWQKNSLTAGGGTSVMSLTEAGQLNLPLATVAAAVAVASTHKLTLLVGATTYYLLATNVA